MRAARDRRPGEPRLLRNAGALADWQIAKLQNWRHRECGFDAGEAPIAAGDALGCRRLAAAAPRGAN